MAILTISREFGSGGREIGQAVAEALGYEYVDKERILGDIRAFGHKWEDWGKDLDEHCPTIWEKYDWSFRGFGALTQQVILAHAFKDRVVIVGRGGNFLLRGIPYSLRIRVVAPLEKRVARIMERDSVDRETARWLAAKVDHDRMCFLHALYGKQWSDSEDYDMLFDTGARTVEEVTNIAKIALRERDCLNTEENRGTLRMRALAARVKAGLLTDQSIFIPVLDVSWDGKHLVLRGTVHNLKERKRIEDRARTLAGDTYIECDLHYRG
jgi:cytidylate kinase